MPDGLSIQETYYPSLTCFGCGHANARGLRLRSYEVDGVVRGTFTPWPEHDNGGGYLNVTAGLDVRFRRPTPLREPVELTGVRLMGDTLPAPPPRHQVPAATG